VFIKKRYAGNFTVGTVPGRPKKYDASKAVDECRFLILDVLKGKKDWTATIY
jgi:hypothetical protein